MTEESEPDAEARAAAGSTADPAADSAAARPEPAILRARFLALWEENLSAWAEAEAPGGAARRPSRGS